MGTIYLEYMEGVFSKDVIRPLAVWSCAPQTRYRIQPIRVYTNIEANQPVYVVYTVNIVSKTWRILSVCKFEKDIENIASGYTDPIYIFTTIVRGRYAIDTISLYC